MGNARVQYLYQPLGKRRTAAVRVAHSLTVRSHFARSGSTSSVRTHFHGNAIDCSPSMLATGCQPDGLTCGPSVRCRAAWRGLLLQAAVGLADGSERRTERRLTHEILHLLRVFVTQRLLLAALAIEASCMCDHVSPKFFRSVISPCDEAVLSTALTCSCETAHALRSHAPDPSCVATSTPDERHGRHGPSSTDISRSSGRAGSTSPTKHSLSAQRTLPPFHESSQGRAGGSRELERLAAASSLLQDGAPPAPPAAAALAAAAATVRGGRPPSTVLSVLASSSPRNCRCAAVQRGSPHRPPGRQARCATRRFYPRIAEGRC